MKVAKLDIKAMNDLELKGVLLSMIGKAKRKQLIRLFEAFQDDEILTDINNLPYALTAEQEAELMISLEESYQEDNLMDLEDAKKIHSRWLKQ